MWRLAVCRNERSTQALVVPLDCHRSFPLGLLQAVSLKRIERGGIFSQNETAGLSAENPSERRNGGGYIKNLLHKTNKLASGLTQKPDWIPPFFGEGHQPVHMCLFFPPSAKWGRFWQRSTRRHRSLVFRRPPLEKGAVHGTSHCRHRAFGRRTPGTKRPSEDLKALADLP